MSKPLARLAVLLIALTGVASALAQPHLPSKHMVLGPKIFIVFRPDVKAELKVTEEQSKTILDAFEGSLQVEGSKIMITMDGSQDLDAMAKSALKILGEEQRKRLEELWVQQLGAIAVADDDIGKTLKLNDEQKKKISALVDDTADELTELFMAGPDDSTAKKAKGIRERASQKALALLDGDQKKAFEAMKGKPFKFKVDGP